ncbi:hypothetical protein F5148DRAFT_1199920 [Russula earlei]|uniref:Uncharacterized protein n=1 Tax=Russula earlei TaxID=71964 RepID=A0ACC0U8T7_9AGAM|nr:hypothetical protein F5148DRAFT_1199920 [Russula earlei]
MCGRFALALQADDVEQLDGDRYVPRYNEPALVMHSMRWGLVPHWSKAEPPTLNTINARAENLEEGGGMWGGIKGRKRCVVVAQGRETQRIPHFTRREDRRLMLFAGLYDSAALDGLSEPLWTFTIVTTAANSSSAWLHDRQPVMLTSQEALDRWLDTSTQAWDPKLSRLLDPYSDADGPLECYAVPTEVGKVGVESPTFIEPVQARKDGIEAIKPQLPSRQSAPQRRDAPSPVTAAEGGGKRKRETSPAEGDALGLATATPPRTPLPSPSRKPRVKAQCDPVQSEPELVDDVEDTDAGTRASAERNAGDDVEIVSGPSRSNASRRSKLRKDAKPKTEEEGKVDIPASPSSPLGSRRQEQQQREPRTTLFRIDFSEEKAKRASPRLAIVTPRPSSPIQPFRCPRFFAFRSLTTRRHARAACPSVRPSPSRWCRAGNRKNQGRHRRSLLFFAAKTAGWND